jgi:hypothetical protein
MRGSIVKRQGKGRKRGKPVDLYYVVYQVGRRQKWEAVKEPRTRKHAEELLAERLSEVHRGEFVEPTNITFKEFKDRWVGILPLGKGGGLGLRAEARMGGADYVRTIRGGSGYLSQSDSSILIGLGDQEGSVDVLFNLPGGRPWRLSAPTIGQYHHVMLDSLVVAKVEVPTAEHGDEVPHDFGRPTTADRQDLIDRHTKEVFVKIGLVVFSIAAGLLAGFAL